MNKRPREESGFNRPRKCLFGKVKVCNESVGELKHFRFRILMPNGTTLELNMREARNEIPIEEFIDAVKKEYCAVVKLGSLEPKRIIDWEYQDLHFKDAQGNMIRTQLKLLEFTHDKWHFLWLHDGSPEPNTYEDMWDLTPNTDLLKELPHDYTFETAIADLIDNSLQALWSNNWETRLISVQLHANKIIVFDSGPGMDGTDGNLVNWGKMGASLHRPARTKGIGGNPPYLMPFFGMFGYGGAVATMWLGRRAVVSSKTKKSNKVFTLHLERDALLTAADPDKCWRTKGGMRDPSIDEKENSPHGTFTKVEIFEPTMKIDDIKHFQCKLKDIYFPYIQCDEISGKTSRPVTFRVNGEDLAEIQGGEVASTNLHSCNGPDFTLQLQLSINQEPSSMIGQRERKFLNANARLKFVYFPIVKGKESINSIIDCLDADGYGIGERYETFSRVSIRRLGRLLPDARWASLPFMEPKQRVGEKAKIMQRCCSRVKCFIDTDAGFNPTPHKTDLAQHHPYTKALKNFGSKVFENETEVQIDISKDGNQVNLPQLEKLYQAWISDMHGNYDEEIEELDQPTVVICTSKIKKLGVSSDVLRLHKKIERRGKCWTAGQKIKVLKGACAGCHSNNVYATLEYILLEGLSGDGSCDAQLICRTLDTPEDRGCKLHLDEGNLTLDICESKLYPVRIIDSDKCKPVDDAEWKSKSEQHRKKQPSAIELLSNRDCQKLEINGGKAADVVNAGDAIPEKIVAVIRPKSYNSANNSSGLDQKFIFRDNRAEMTLQVLRNGKKTSDDLIWSVRVPPSSHRGLDGLYVFHLNSKCLSQLRIAGSYTFKFSLSLKRCKDVHFKQTLQVLAANACSWKVVGLRLDDPYRVRVGSFFDPFHIACSDPYGNRVKFKSVPKLTIKLSSSGTVLAHVSTVKRSLSSDKSTMIIEGIVVKSDKLDDIRPNYEATLNIATLDEAFHVAFPCRVLPGPPESIIAHLPNKGKKLIPGQIIEGLALEIFDECGNHAKEGERILLSVDGFSYEDRSGVLDDETTCMKKVDSTGFVVLSNILKVSKGYGKDVYLSVSSEDKVILKMSFQTEMRELRTVSKVLKNCTAGSHLENVVFEIVNSEGIVDENLNHDDKLGQSHTLTIKSDTLDIDNSVQYTFRNGCCTVRSLPLPRTEGVFSFSAAHSRYPELALDIEVHVENTRHECQQNIWRYGDDAGHPVFSPLGSSKSLRFLPPTPSFKASNPVQKLFSPLSPREIAEPPASQSPKTPRGNTVPASHSSRTSMESAECVSQSPGSRKDNGVSVNRSLMTLKSENTGSQDKFFDILQSQVSSPLDQGDWDACRFNLKELGDYLVKYRAEMGQYQSELEVLDRKLYDLQNSSDAQDHDFDDGCGQEFIIEKIKRKSQSAAVIISKIYEETPLDLRGGNIFGIVALLGSVDRIELSRMLSLYLGDSVMCAVVCKNYGEAMSFENDINSRGSTSGECYTLCTPGLEDASSINCDPGSDPQDLLSLMQPAMPNGNIPAGFLGYAVNMINIEATLSQWRTTNGRGLRETLFYRLFGALQVYDKRSRMIEAQSCIKDGAISLDGGILRGNGLLSFGQWEPDVMFPVLKNKDTSRDSEVARIIEERDKVRKSHDRVAERFFKASAEYNRRLNGRRSNLALP